MRRCYLTGFLKSVCGLGFAASLCVAGLTSPALAGDVQVVLEGALLKVTGDNTANQVSLVQTAVGDVFVQGATGTTVNGAASAVLRRVALNAVEIRMEGGNDVVSLRGFNIGNDLYVNLGSGNDRLQTTGPITVQDQLTIEGAAGNDTVRLAGATIGLDLHIDGGIGSLAIDLASLDNGKTLTVIGDEASENLTVTDCMVGDYIAIETKGGNDRVTIRESFAFGLALATDAGADTVNISDFLSDESIGIFTGVANDSVNLVNVATSTNLTISVDEGDDRVSGQSVSAGADAVFEGGSGNDTLTDLGITGGTKKDIKEFEVLLP